jgi:hypothetical protein
LKAGAAGYRGDPHGTRTDPVLRAITVDAVCRLWEGAEPGIGTPAAKEFLGVRQHSERGDRGEQRHPRGRGQWIAALEPGPEPGRLPVLAGECLGLVPVQGGKQERRHDRRDFQQAVDVLLDGRDPAAGLSIGLVPVGGGAVHAHRAGRGGQYPRVDLAE